MARVSVSETGEELVAVLLEVDRTKAELEAAMGRDEPAVVIRTYYDRFIEALAAKKKVGL